MILIWITFATILGTGLCITIDDCPETAKRDLYHLKVLRNSCFQFELSDENDYEEAQEACRKNGGFLAMSKDAETSNFLANQLTRVFRYKGRVYIGLNDKEDEGDYVWEDGTHLDDGVYGYTNWAPNKGPERNFIGRKLKDCVTIDTEENGRWADDQCGKDKHYICEYKVSVSRQGPVGDNRDNVNQGHQGRQGHQGNQGHQGQKQNRGNEQRFGDQGHGQRFDNQGYGQRFDDERQRYNDDEWAG